MTDHDISHSIVRAVLAMMLSVWFTGLGLLVWWIVK